MFEDGGIDYGIFQSTYLKSWYTTGFNTPTENALWPRSIRTS